MLALLLLLAILGTGGAIGYRYLRTYVIPPDYAGSGTGDVVVQVKQNETATDVAGRLLQLGVVQSARAFIKAAEDSHQQANIEPGFYRLHKQMKAAAE